MRTFIAMAWELWGVGWVLIGGDDDAGMPLRYGTPPKDALPPPNGSAENYIPTDLYFNDLDGNWDVDLDRIYGEIEDDSANPYPEVFVGRVLSRTIAEANNWRLKHETYSRTPQNREILDRFLGIANDDDNWNTLSELYNVIIAPYGNPGYLYKNIAANAAVDALDNGYGLCAIYCDGKLTAGHPNTTSFICGTDNYVWGWCLDDNATNSGINHLETYDEHYIVFTVNTCRGAMYDNMIHQLNYTLTDGFMDANQGTGAVAFMGLTRMSLAHDHELAMSFFGSLMENPSQPVGSNYAEAKCDLDFNNSGIRYTCYCHNFFGNPLMRAWTKVPEFMYAFFPTLIPPGPQQFTVRVLDRQLQGVPYAYVCLYKEFDIYNTGHTDPDGRVTFQISPSSPGEMVVTCTDYGSWPGSGPHLPYQGTATIGGELTRSGLEDQKEPLVILLSITSYSSISKSGFKFRYSVPSPKPMEINLYNAIGAKVFSRSWSPPTQGYYDFTLPISIPSGVYWVELKQGNKHVTKKLVVLK